MVVPFAKSGREQLPSPLAGLSPPLGLGVRSPAFGVISLALMVAALTFVTFPLALIPPPLALVAVSLALIPASLALMTAPLTGGKPRRRLADQPLPLAVQSFFHATQPLNTPIYRQLN